MSLPSKLLDRFSNYLADYMSPLEPDPIPTKEELERMDIEHLYGILTEYVRQTTPLHKVISTSIRGQIAFIIEFGRVIGRSLIADTTPQGHDQLAKESEEGLRRRLDGMDIETEVTNDLTGQELMELEQNGAVVLVNHQGGGVEVYEPQSLMDITAGIVLKDDLAKIPLVKTVLEKRRAIIVNRNMLRKKPEDRKETREEEQARITDRRLEIERLADEIVDRLAIGDKVVLFPEGTRSKDGRIGHTEARQDWARDLLGAIQAEWDGRQREGTIPKDKKFKKVMLIINAMAQIPDAFEKDYLISRFYPGKITAHITSAEGLTGVDSADLYDQKTLYGKMRFHMKRMLIKRLNELRSKDSLTAGE